MTDGERLEEIVETAWPGGTRRGWSRRWCWAWPRTACSGGRRL